MFDKLGHGSLQAFSDVIFFWVIIWTTENPRVNIRQFSGKTVLTSDVSKWKLYSHRLVVNVASSVSDDIYIAVMPFC